MPSNPHLENRTNIGDRTSPHGTPSSSERSSRIHRTATYVEPTPDRIPSHRISWCMPVTQRELACRQCRSTQISLVTPSSTRQARKLSVPRCEAKMCRARIPFLGGTDVNLMYPERSTDGVAQREHPHTFCSHALLTSKGSSSELSPSPPCQPSLPWRLLL